MAVPRIMQPMSGRKVLPEDILTCFLRLRLVDTSNDIWRLDDLALGQSGTIEDRHGTSPIKNGLAITLPPLSRYLTIYRGKT